MFKYNLYKAVQEIVVQSLYQILPVVIKAKRNHVVQRFSPLHTLLLK